jgi:hypothetical protein
MSRGIGKTQRRILDELAANDRAALTVINPDCVDEPSLVHCLGYCLQAEAELA